LRRSSAFDTVPTVHQQGGLIVETHILFFLAAILAGAINALAGGGGLITFPLLALVVPPVTADATSALALLPAYPAAVWRTRGELSGVTRRQLWLLLVPSVLGGLVGALLLVWTGDRNFVFLVPWLVLVGTVLFVLEPTLGHRPHDGTPPHRGFVTALWPLGVATTFAVALYGGYFGAGIGILMISALSLYGMGDLRRVVALKNLLTGCLRGVAVLVLIVEGAVNWGYGLPMAFGGLMGGYLAGLVSGRVNHTILRGVVIAIGFGVAAYYFLTLYGPPELHIGGE
jgi:uncharacterized protein